MKILHIATLVSPDGAYGGPVRVAVNQCRELQELGHTVTLAAGYTGFETPPKQMDNVPLQLFPTTQIVPGIGFAGLSSYRLLRWVIQAAQDYDVVHIHLARDLVTLPAAAAALRANRKLFIQTHGMIDPTTHPLARPLDAVLTKGALRRAERVFYLTDTEKEGLLKVVPGIENLQRLINGVPRAAARTNPTGTEVLFLARLHPRKRAIQFVHSALELSQRHPDVRWRIVGPDEGEGDQVREALARTKSDIRWEGSISPELVNERLSRASIYCLPSVDEPFPMAALEAMSMGLPVIITDTCGIADVVAKTSSGLITNGTQEDLTRSLDAILTDRAFLGGAGERALNASREYFDMAGVAHTLESAYLS